MSISRCIRSCSIGSVSSNRSSCVDNGCKVVGPEWEGGIKSVVDGIILNLECGLSSGNISGVIEIGFSNRGRGQQSVFSLLSGVKCSLFYNIFRFVDLGGA